MADPNAPARRLSMSYVLGFSNKPFKDVKPPTPPRPPQPHPLAQMVGYSNGPVHMSQGNNIQVTTPGAAVEWAASDGRKGKLTGTGKQLLTAASLAKVPSEKRSVKDALGVGAAETKAPSAKAPSAKAATVKAASNAGDAWGFGDFNAAAGFDAVDGAEGEEKKEDNDNPHGWTEEDDKKLMDWKNENGNGAWLKCAEDVGKPENECKERFKQIKPADWKPNASKGGGGGKKGKNKGKDQNQGQGQGKKEEKKDEASGGDGANTGWDSGTGGAANASGGNNGWGQPDTTGNTNGNANDNQETWGTGGDSGGNNGVANGDEAAWNSGGGANDNAGEGGGNGWGDTDNTGGGAAAAGGGDDWQTPANGGGAPGGWGTNNDQNNNTNTNDNTGNTANSWDNPAPANPASKPASKAPTHHSSHHKSHSNSARTATAAPLTVEVSPDNTFSADDLRLIARILQQDCSMVWNRVSWRFRDKTGRTLHPDVFEKKITGGVEGKESERGGRRG